MMRFRAWMVNENERLEFMSQASHKKLALT